jgi:hypothetical protein
MHQNQGSVVYGVVFGAALLATPVQAEVPHVGEVQRLTVITISLQVGSTEKETRRVSYTPPPGWYVRGHSVQCKEKTGNSSFTVNTVPRDWTFVSEEQVAESYKLLLDLAGKAHDAGLTTKLTLEQEQTLTEVRKGRSSHHALVVEATAKGEGFFRGGGSIQMTVTAELVYVGTPESLARSVAQAKGG